MHSSPNHHIYESVDRDFLEANIWILNQENDFSIQKKWSQMRNHIAKISMVWFLITFDYQQLKEASDY